MSETTRVVIVNAEEFGLRESADFLEQHSDECDPAYLAAVAASMRQAADSLAAHAQAVQRLTEELQQSQAALAALRARVVHPGYGNAWECVVCGETWVDAGAHPDKAHPDNGCLARLRPRPEGST